MVSFALAAVAAASSGCEGQRTKPTQPAGQATTASVQAPGASGAGLPRLVDVGAGKCIPCKAMAPILDQLRTEYHGRFEVQFVDVWVNPDAAGPYAIRMIPTQIFYAPDGRELSRHEGFMSRDDILGRWKTLGFAF